MIVPTPKGYIFIIWTLNEFVVSMFQQRFVSKTFTKVYLYTNTSILSKPYRVLSLSYFNNITKVLLLTPMCGAKREETYFGYYHNSRIKL